MMREEIKKILTKYEPKEENLLAILHELQDSKETHHLTKEELIEVSNYLKLPTSYIMSVLSFYSMYSIKPRGKYVIRVCQSPPCHHVGAVNIAKELMRVLGVSFGETTKDGLFTLEFTSCIGVCGVAPAMMINDEVYGNLTPEKIQSIIEELRRKK